MSLFKFSLYILLFFSFTTQAMFSDQECFQANFDTEVKHKSGPLGFIDKSLVVAKSNCLITLKHTQAKYLENQWRIDICRSPIHIKEGTSGVEVHKKNGDCKLGRFADTSFCKASFKVMTLLQDDGLIFADGQKEDLGTPHGNLHCANLLLESYLGRDLVFGLKEKYQNTLDPKKVEMKVNDANCELPGVKKKEEVTKEVNVAPEVTPIQMEEEKDDATVTF